MTRSMNDTERDDLRNLVNRAIDEGRADQLDVIVRARFACEWGGGDALHRELIDEVERLRAAAAPFDELFAVAARRGATTVLLAGPFQTQVRAERELEYLLGDDYYRDQSPYVATRPCTRWKPATTTTQEGRP